MKTLFNVKTMLISMLLVLSASGLANQKPPANKALFDQIEEQIKEKNLPGMVLVVMQQGEVSVHKAFGYSNIENKTPMETDHVFRLFSMTKPITALATLKWMNDNKLPITTPLQHFYPEFDSQQEIPMHTLLNHTSGMSYGFKINRIAGWSYLFSGIESSKSLSEFMDIMSGLPLLSSPGERWRYSFSSDVQGALLEKVTGGSLAEYFAEHIFSPLEMNNTSFYLDDKAAAKLVPMYGTSWFSDKLSQQKVEQHLTDPNVVQSGGGGLLSTAMDYMKFVKLLTYPALYPSVVQPAYVHAMQQNQLAPGIQGVPKRLYSNSGFGYGLGVKLTDEKYLSKGSVYWAGRGGTVFWVDKKRELAVVAMMQVEGGNRELEKWLVPTIYDWLEGTKKAKGMPLAQR